MNKTRDSDSHCALLQTKTDRRSVLRGMAFASIGGGLVALGAKAAMPFSTNKAELEAAARKQGVVRALVSPGAFPDLVAAFNKRVPWLKVEYVRASSGQVHQRFMTEARSGASSFDILINWEFLLREASDAGYLANYQPAEAAGIRSNLIAVPGQIYPVFLALMCAGWNTEVVRPEERPSTWKELANPSPASKKLGRMMPSPLQTFHVELHLYNLRKRFGLPYIEELASLQPRVLPSATAMVPLLTSGSNPIALFLPDNTAYGAWMQGKPPLEWIVPSEGTTTMNMDTAITTNAGNLDAAKFFMEYLLSDEGQTDVARTIGATPARALKQDPRPIPPAIKLDPESVWSVDWADFNKVHEEWKKDLVRLFGI